MASSTSDERDDFDEDLDRAAETPTRDCEWAPPPASKRNVRWARPALGLDNFS